MAQARGGVGGGDPIRQPLVARPASRKVKRRLRRVPDHRCAKRRRSACWPWGLHGCCNPRDVLARHGCRQGMLQVHVDALGALLQPFPQLCCLAHRPVACRLAAPPACWAACRPAGPQASRPAGLPACKPFGLSPWSAFLRATQQAPWYTISSYIQYLVYIHTYTHICIPVDGGGNRDCRQLWLLLLLVGCRDVNLQPFMSRARAGGLAAARSPPTGFSRVVAADTYVITYIYVCSLRTESVCNVMSVFV